MKGGGGALMTYSDDDRVTDTGCGCLLLFIILFVLASILID